jgi:hypothetical protein
MRLLTSTSGTVKGGVSVLWTVIIFCSLQASAATFYWNRNEYITQDRDFSRATNWTANANGTGLFAASNLDDDFTSNTLGSPWTYFDKVGDGFSSNSLTTNADQLTLNARGADIWLTTNAYNGIWRKDIHGNIDVSVKIVSQSNTDGYAKAGIMIANDITNLGDGGYFFVGITPGHGVTFDADQTGTIGEFDYGLDAGTTAYPVWLRLVKNGLTVTGYYRTSTSSAWTFVGSSTSQGTRLKSHVALINSGHNTVSTNTTVFDDFTGGGTIATTGLDLSLNGSGSGSDASATFGSSDLSVNSIDFTGYGGTLDMGGEHGLFATYYDDKEFTGTSISRVDSMVSMDWGAASPGGSLGIDSWSARWEGYVVPRTTDTYTFYCKSDDGCRLWVDNKLLVDQWVNQGSTEITGSPTLSLTAGTRYSIVAEMYDDASNAWSQVKWACSTIPKEVIPKRDLYAGKLTVTGTGTVVNMAAGTITASDGLIDFTAASGTQTFVPRSGQTMPNIRHSGAGMLSMSTNALTAIGFYQSAGTFNFNAMNPTIVANGTNRGDFQIWNGTASTFQGLANRTITVAGNASIAGSPGNLVNMNPASNVNFNVTGKLTCDYCAIANNTASVSQGIAYKSTGSSINNWVVNGGTFYWNRNDIITSSTSANRIYNWTSNADGTGYRPEATGSDKFEDQTLNSNWVWRDRDNDEAQGTYNQSGGQLLMSARGADVYGSTNEFATLYRTDLTGDNFDVTVKIMSQNASDGWGKAGIIVANNFASLGSGGYAFIAITPGNNIAFHADVNAPLGEIDGGAGGGTLAFPIWLRLVRNGTSLSGYWRTSLSNAWTQSNATVTPSGLANGTNSQVGLFVCSHSGSTTMSVAFDDFEGASSTGTAGYISATDNDLSFNGTAGGSDDNGGMGADLSANSIVFTNYTGTFSFNTWNLTLTGGNATFVAGQGLSAASGTLSFTGASGTQTFTPKSGATYNALVKSGAGTLAIATNDFTGSDLTLSGGTLDIGSGRSHTLTSISTSGSPTLTFNGSALTISTGNADLSGLGTLNTSAGSAIAFSRSTAGTQVFTPKSGSTHPNITKSGATATLQLATNALTARSLVLSAGTMDFAGLNVTINNSGNFSVTGGGPSTIANLGGSTLTVAGTTSFAGSIGSMLNINPSSTWTLNSTGAVTSSYATVANCNASGSATIAVASNSTNGGGNQNWNFPTTDYTAWNYSSQINFNTTSTGANISSNLSNFPVLVRLDSNNFIFPQADPTGDDLRFGDPDGNGLSYEIERWDATLKKAEIWVMVPTIDGNSNRDYINMFWGNSAASAASSGSAVFNSGMNWVAAWHLKQNGSQPSYADASAAANTGTGQNGGAGDTVTANIGFGYRLNGTNRFLTSTNLYSNIATLTIGAWFRTTTPGGKMIGFQTSQTGLAGQYDRHLWMDNTGKLNFGVYSGGNRIVSSTSSYNDGAWHYAVARTSPLGLFLFVDGLPVASNTSYFSGENTTGYWRAGWGELGAWSPAPSNLYFTGHLDEITINHGELSADWIKFAYYNQKQNSTVLTYVNSALGTWAYSQKIYVNTTATGANTTADVANFPMLVRLTKANFDFTQARSDGGDLRFTDSTGALLSYEIERYDAAAMTAAVWVLIPSVKANDNSQWFRMYWGKPVSSTLSSANSVFQPANGFAGVWHLNEDGNIATGGYADASGYGNGGSGILMTNTSDVAGVAGYAQNLDGTTQYITMAGTAYPAGAAARTMSVWARSSGAVANRIIAAYGTYPGSGPQAFGLVQWNSSGNWGGWTNTGGGDFHSGISPDASWHHLSMTFDGTNSAFFVDGIQTSTANTSTLNTVGATLVVGARMNDKTLKWAGVVDELEIGSVQRSASWVKLQYESQKTASMVLTLGARSSDFAKSVRFNFNTTSTGANVSGNVANIPILVRLTSSNFDFSATLDAGTDLRFVDKDGSYLYHEVSEWDKANKSGKLWVKVPQVDGNSTTDFFTLYYGCATCAANPYAVEDSVWSSYNAVYHLNGGTGDVNDASPYAATATRTADMATMAGITTPLSPVMNGITDQVIIPNAAQLDGETMTAGFWIKTTAVGTNATWFNSSWLVDRDASGTANAGWAVVFANGTGRIRFVAVEDDLNSTVDLSNGAWRRVDVVKTPTNKYIYIDGALDVSEADVGAISNDDAVSFGGENGSARFSAGQWNEFSYSATQRSADYIKLSFENQKEASTFFSTTTFTTASFQRTKVFRLNTSPSGANVPGDVFNFPLLLRITGTGTGSATAITDLAQSAGQDIRFLDGDGVTWLDYQIERWSQAVDSAEVWVKVPRIRGNSTSDFITMYYQQAASVTVPDGQCASCVFSAANGYTAAWHMAEAGNNTADNFVNAVGNGYNGTGSNLVAGSSVSALSGKGLSLDGTGDWFGTSGSPVLASMPMTVSGWAYRAGTGTGDYLFSQGTAAASAGLHFGYRATNYFTFAFYSDDLSTVNTYAALNTWTHWTGTFDPVSKTRRIYCNGVLENSGTSSGQFTGSGVVRVGNSAWSGDDFNGTLDEVNVSTVVRSADWIKLSYQNQRRDASPLFNPTTTDFQKSRKYTFNTTRTGANVMGDVTDFPLLVRVTDANAGILDQVQGSGTTIPGDIRFLDGDGRTWLNYQVERWDRGVDSGEVWVRIPQVDGNSDHDFITMYYQQVSGVTIADGQCANCVFDTTNGFASTWHLNNSLSDATVNANNGTNQGSADGEGVAASGRSFSGTAQYATFGNGNSLKTISSAITVEAWLRTSQTPAAFKSIIRHDGHYTALQVTSATTAETFAWRPTQVGGSFTWAPTFNDGAWQHFVSQYDMATGLKVYRNGSLYFTDATMTGALATGATDVFSLGGTSGGAELYIGKMDEVRVYDVAKDSNWIKLDYETQRRTGNLFWNSRLSPNNTAAFTALTVASGNISLSWSSSVSDSSNADSVGIWVKYSGYPDSANAPAASAGSATHVVNLPKTDSAYTYPATYPGTYWFGLAVRNTGGKWSPFTVSSSDSAFLGTYYYPDTVYVDSAIGLDSYTCSQARNPATPKLTVSSAVSTCSATDTLVVRVMPGTYTTDNSFTKLAGNLKTHIVSFDNNSRAILNGAGSVLENSRTWNYTVAINSNMTLRQMDVRAASNGHIGVYIRQNADSVTLDGLRIYGGGGNVYDTAISMCNTATEYLLFQNNIIYQPAVYGIDILTDNRTNILNNVFYGSGGSSKGIYMPLSALNEKFNISNNIFYNWSYGIHTTDANSEIGNVSNNMFFLVTTNQEVVGETDAAKLIKDPLFANTVIGSPHGFKLLPGSPAIDAGTSTLTTGTGAYTNGFAATDFWGSSRTIGSARDIGAYEGSGYTPNPTGEFDSLIVTTTATTATVYNSKWKVVFDKAKGGGISEFYDQSAPSTNLLFSGTVLFDDKVASTSASSQSSIAPTVVEQGKARVVVKQRFAYSASLDVNFYYTIHPSGHIFVQVEYVNLSAGSLSPGTIDYTLKVNNAVTVFNTKAKDGFAYVTTATRDAALIVARPLDDGAQPSADVWTGSSASGSAGNVVFNSTALAAMPRYYKRYHHFLIYIGDAFLDFAKTSAINADVSAPSALSATSGGLIHERSWQDQLGGHWSFDDGAGSVARDKSVYYANHGTITGAKFVSGKINAALTFTSSDVVVVADADVLEAAQNHTYMFWFKPNFGTMGTDAYVISKGQNSTDGWSFRRNASASTIRFRMGATTVDSPALTTGVWTHIALVMDTDNILRLYVDGVLQGVSAGTATATANASTLRIGENDAGTAANRFVGDIDDVRVYLVNVPNGEIQSVYNRGFSQRFGGYVLRSDNNNRLVALINGAGAQTRVQPAFQIDNWSGPATPKFVYLNGERLTPNTDFCSGIVSVGAVNEGFRLLIQLNRNLTGADQTLFIDDDDSSGYMGTAGLMKTLAVSVTSGDKITFQNFSGSTFGSATSGQWYTEVDLNGWLTYATMATVDQGFGEFNVWKAAAINPNVAVSGGTNQVGIDDKSGRTLTHFKFDDTGNDLFSSGIGYAGPATIGYTLADSSSTRISMTLSAMSMQSAEGTFTLTKRWTVYPTGRIIGNFAVTAATFDLDDPALDITGRFNASPVAPWAGTYADNNSRYGWMGGDLNFHSIVGGVTTLKSGGAIVSDKMDGGTSSNQEVGTGGLDYRRARLSLQNADFTAAKNPVTTNFFVDISRDFTDSATADSMAKDLQTPAVLTAITGSRTTTDALDFNADNFAEGDGAYTYQAAGGIAHFKFVNTVTHFNPAFRVGTWTYGTLPEIVILDNQILTRGYGYNAYLNTSGANGGEVILQFNKTITPGTHVIFISHKTGLAVTLRSFEAKGGDGADTLDWVTESEFENLGYHVYRRVAPGQLDSALAGGPEIAGAGVANALRSAARTQAAAKAAARMALDQRLAKTGADSTLDTVPKQNLSPQELADLGFVRITPKLIPGAKGGSASSTQNYRFIDRTAAFGVEYEYMLESVDFNGNKDLFGPRAAKPSNPLATELQSNYPNPFNPITTLRFSLKEKLKVSLIIYDSKGRLVRTLVRPDKAMAPGKYKLIWDARDENGFEVSSGQYYYRFTAARYVKTRKMILVK